MCGHIWVLPAFTLKLLLRVWRYMTNIIFVTMRYKQESYGANWDCMIAFVSLWDQRLLYLQLTAYLLPFPIKLLKGSACLRQFLLFPGVWGSYCVFSEAEKRADIITLSLGIFQPFPYSLAPDGPNSPPVWTDCSRNEHSCLLGPSFLISGFIPGITSFKTGKGGSLLETIRECWY